MWPPTTISMSGIFFAIAMSMSIPECPSAMNLLIPCALRWFTSLRIAAISSVNLMFSPGYDNLIGKKALSVVQM